MGQRLPYPDFWDCLFQFVIGSVEVGTKAKTDKKFDKDGHCSQLEGCMIQISIRCVEVCTLRVLFWTTERNKDAPEIGQRWLFGIQR